MTEDEKNEGSLPYRQLRKRSPLSKLVSARALPYRQLRKPYAGHESAPTGALPYRQLRNVNAPAY